MERPAYLDPHTESTFTEVHSSAWQCGPSVVRRHLRNGFDPNSKDERGWTPLIWLFRMGDPKHVRARKRIFRWLIEAGADINVIANSGHNVLQLAKSVCSPTFYRFLEREHRRINSRGRVSHDV
jgi:ankyrin repeat protein